MGMRAKGLGALITRLENVAKKAPKESQKALEEGGNKIKREAIRRAPVDEGNLENAIYGPEDDEGIKKDYGGIHGRKRFYVGVDGSHETDRLDRSVGDYALIMHESVYELGDKSKDKQKDNPDITVGRKFLESAVEDLEAEISAEINEAFARELNKR